MKKFLLFLFAAVILFMSGCGAENAPDMGSEAYISFLDSSGNTVTLYKKPEKTAVLFSSFADIWRIAGGSVDITVGEAVERGFADDGAVLADGGAGKSIDIEKIIAASPDFVIGSLDIPAQVNAAEVLENAGIPCALFRVESFDDYLDVLKICTDITGASEAFEKYGTDVKKRVDDILSDVSQQTEPKRILFIRSGSSSGAAKAKTADDHFAAQMLKELGAYNIADNAPVLLDGLSVEEIIREDPDIIFISVMGDEDAAHAYMDGVLAEAAWQSLGAVKNGKCFYLPKELFQFKPNEKWDEAYSYLAELLTDGD